LTEAAAVKIRLREGVYEVDHLSLDLVRDNATLLQRRGLYERALLRAFIDTNHATFSLSDLRQLFETADRARLRAAGDPLPGSGPFTLYRGVAGQEPHRRVRGLSWTSTLDQARWFAQQHALREAEWITSPDEWITSPDPGVYQVTIDDRHVLAYTNAHKEEGEFIVILPTAVKAKRVE
jgi:hypothetical protein